MPKIYQQFALTLNAYQNCVEKGNFEWEERHLERLESLEREFLPSGSGFDSGTTLDIDASTPNKLVFHTSFHHLHASGYYDGWTDHKVTVTPNLAFGFDLRVSGRNKNGIKEYIAEVFHSALMQD